MKSFILLLLLFACAQQEKIEPKFCWTCHELNVGGSKSNYIFGEGYTKICDKEPADEFYEYWTADSVYHYHKLTCIKDLEHANR